MDADFISALYDLNKLMPKGGMKVSPEAYQGLQDATQQDISSPDPRADARPELERYSAAYDQPDAPPPNALVRYGNHVLVPDAGTTLNALGQGLEVAGGTLGGMGPIGGSLNELSRLPRKMAEYLASSGRGMTAEGKLYNDLVYADKSLDATRYQVSRFNPRASDFPPSPEVPPSTTTAGKLADTSRELKDMQEMLGQMPGKNAQRLDEFKGTIDNALSGSGPKALPKPDPMVRGQSMPNRNPDFGYQGRYEGALKSVRNEANPDLVPPEPGLKQATQKYEFDRGVRAKDEASGGPSMREQMANDEHVDKFVSSLTGQPAIEIPDAISFYAKTKGVSINDVVASMARRGYDIQQLATHVYQTRGKGGQFGPLDPTARAFLSAARGTRKTR